MILRDVVLMVIVAGLMFSAIFTVVNSLNPPSMDDSYSEYITNVEDSLTSYGVNISEDISHELESGEADVSSDSSDLSMWSSAYKVIKMVLDIPRIALLLLTETSQVLGLSSATWIIKGVLAIIITVISFLILTVVARIRT